MKYKIEPGADLSGADLREADLRGADLSGADLAHADLAKADLSGANLRGADLTFAHLDIAQLIAADLRGATLHRTDLRGANLREADLRGALLTSDDHEHGLTSARFDHADLRGLRTSSKYDGLSLMHTSLRGADLRGLDLRGISLFCADVTGAKFDGALLEDNQLEWVIGGRQKVQVPSRHSLSVALEDKVKTNILLSCSGEYLGEVSEMETVFDHGHVPGPDGYVKVREPSIGYATVKITPRDGGQWDVLELLKQQVRDHMPRDYDLENVGDTRTIRGVLTGVALDKRSGTIKMSIDMRRGLIDLLTARAQEASDC